MHDHAHTPDATDLDLAAQVAQLTQRVDELTALLAQATQPAGVAAPAPVAPTAVAAAPEAAPAADQVVGRRDAIRHGGKLAAAAIAGGGVIVAATASPAAATTLTGAGNPGMTAVGQGGPGINASTDSGSAAAVNASATVAGSQAVKAVHAGNGFALQAQGGASSTAVASIESSTSTTALKASSTGYAAELTGGGNGSPTLGVVAGGTGNAVAITQSGTGGGLLINGPGTAGTGLSAQNVSLGGVLSASTLALRLKGPKNHIEFQAADTIPINRSSFHVVGTVVFDGTDLWWCTVAGTPGTWQKLGGASAAGQFHVLPVPVRVYDSRPFSVPTSVGPKTKLAGGAIRPIDMTLNSSGVPLGATAVMVTILLVNTAAGNGNFTIWKNGQARPSSNTMVWGGTTARFSTTALTSVDAAGLCQVSSSLSTDIVLDVLGYYR